MLLALASLLLDAACVQPSLIGEGIRAENPRLSASSTSVQAGEAVTLNWQAGAPRAYLSGVGVVSAQGTAAVVPWLTTTYSLVTDVPTQAQSITIKVVGVKGDNDFFPKINEYSGKQESTRSVESLVEYLGALHRLLQDDLKFVLNDFYRGDTYIFQSHASETSEFLPTKEYGVKSQKISFLVSIKILPVENTHDANYKSTLKNRKPILVNISAAAIIQYQRMSEEQWRTNNNPDLNREKASMLLSKISSLQ